MIARFTRQLMIARNDRPDSTDPNDKTEPIENADPADPIEPIEYADPIDPIEQCEFFDRIDIEDPVDHSERCDVPSSRSIMRTTIGPSGVVELGRPGSP